MNFNIEFMKKKTNAFWDAYFLMLELKKSDREKEPEDVPIVRETDIDETYLLRVGIIYDLWFLVNKQTDTTCATIALDDDIRAFDLLNEYLCQIVD